jgi:hypothetical protein
MHERRNIASMKRASFYNRSGSRLSLFDSSSGDNSRRTTYNDNSYVEYRCDLEEFRAKLAEESRRNRLVATCVLSTCVEAVLQKPEAKDVLEHEAFIKGELDSVYAKSISQAQTRQRIQVASKVHTMLNLYMLHMQNAQKQIERFYTAEFEDSEDSSTSDSESTSVECDRETDSESVSG